MRLTVYAVATGSSSQCAVQRFESSARLISHSGEVFMPPRPTPTVCGPYLWLMRSSTTPTSLPSGSGRERSNCRAPVVSRRSVSTTPARAYRMPGTGKSRGYNAVAALVSMIGSSEGIGSGALTCAVWATVPSSAHPVAAQALSTPAMEPCALSRALARWA